MSSRVCNEGVNQAWEGKETRCCFSGLLLLVGSHYTNLFILAINLLHVKYVLPAVINGKQSPYLYFETQAFSSYFLPHAS